MLDVPELMTASPPARSTRWRPSLRTIRTVIALIGAAVAIYFAVKLGEQPKTRRHLQLGNAAPFFGHRRSEFLPLWPAATFAVVLIAVVPLAQRLRWWLLLGCAWVCAAGWAVLIASAAGWRRVAAPLTSSTDYRAALHQVGTPSRFVRTFVADIHSYPTQVKGHPPLPVLVLWALEHVGLRGPGWSAALIIAVGTSSVVAVALAVRAVAGVDAARRVIPFLVLAPGTAWIATSMDGFFAGVVAWSVALVVIARARTARVAVLATAVGAGLLIGCVGYLSYGLLPVGALVVAALFVRRRPDGTSVPRRGTIAFVSAGIVAGVTAVVVVFTASGFWWPAGVRVTHHLYEHNYGSGSRPYGYFLLADLAVFALMIGPAAIAGIARLNVRRDVTAWFVIAALVAVLASDASGYMRGEVERIWLPYAPWVVVAAGSLTRRRGWLIAQVAIALVVQAKVATPW